ncbi:MAG: peptide transporter TolQ [Planctomycetaceae bacterium]|nr:peptide transporter TolQ [Planctomycetaceae bacterium]
MDYSAILNAAGIFIYGMMGIVAIYGVICVVLLLRKIGQKRFSNPNAQAEFLDEVGELCKKRRFDEVAEMCDTPGLWSKAVPQLIIVALQNQDRSPQKLRRLVAEQFEREILADLEYRLSWINTIVKSAPMLGLLGTVIGMIMAFQTIAGSADTGTDPTALAEDIGIALFTTALGLTIAIPLVLAAAFTNVRIGKLQDAVQEAVGIFLDDFESARKSA